jgi:hypothetical protein
MGIRNFNMHIAQKLSPTPKSKWAIWFKHNLAVLATVASLPAAAEAAADGEGMVVDMSRQKQRQQMGHTTINQKKAAIVAETVKVTATAAAVAEAHTTINQKVAAIAAEIVVEAAVVAAAVAETKTVAEGVAATLAPTALATTEAGKAGGKQQSTNKRQKSGRGGGHGSSHDRGNGGSRDHGDSCGGDEGSGGSGDRCADSRGGGGRCGGNGGRNIIVAAAAIAAAVVHW